MDILRIFVSYAREDRRWFQRDSRYTLIPYLAESLRKENVAFWYDTEELGVGEEFERRIVEAIDHARIALLIVSQSFLASDFIDRVELPRIRACAAQGVLSVVPVLVEPCAWEENEFLSARQMMPGKPTPLIDYADSERDMAHVRYEILNALKKTARRLRSSDSSTDSAGHSAPSSVARPAPEAAGRHLEQVERPPLAAKDSSEAEFVANRDRFLGAMPWLNWVLYDPSTGYDPYRNLHASDWDIRQDLEALRTHGFNGVITMSARQSFKDIPRIAHEVGFHMVVLGVWDLRNQEEIDNAVSAAPHTDAYCTGHRGLNRLYSLKELTGRMRYLREETRRPVTTTELVAEYEAAPALLEMGDFLFPDVHPSWHRGSTPAQAWQETKQRAVRLAGLTGQSQKPVLLKMVSYPSDGAEGLSAESQLEFYCLAVEASREDADFPQRVVFSFATAFDPAWKTEPNGWVRAERYTGLFTADRQPKPAVTGIRWRAKHL